jgi:hypothetical protein
MAAATADEVKATRPNFSGKWNAVKHENFDAFLAAVGMSFPTSPVLVPNQWR